MDIFIPQEPIIIDLVYANHQHSENIFKQALYHPNARLWCDYDLAQILILTARNLNRNKGWTLVLKDCLRTQNAQQAMAETKIVQDNPNWLQEPNRMVSPPGCGAHPRGMAIDVGAFDSQQDNVDFGTAFDDMSECSFRDYNNFPAKILQNRQNLEDAFLKSAKIFDLKILPIPNEWWDFRFPPDITDQYEPLSDEDLPPQMRMHSLQNPEQKSNFTDFPPKHFEKLKNAILTELDSLEIAHGNF